ncbi:MAG TPA: helix-turn-helix domain-containing protein [Pseudonocardiaceae bacterium]|nr:helix-turn-helix domain-containing protein [Pseudonocardiaceae bacterium]
MSLESVGERRVRLLDNPMAIRAMAHPVRLDLLGIVGRDGPITSAAAARRLGISQALASHHMRQLAKYGFVEPAEATNSRDRPWRLTPGSSSWTAAPQDPQSAAAADVLGRLFAERALANLVAWQQRRDDDWRDLTGVSSNLIYLTRDELAELNDAIEALLVPLVDRRKLGDNAPRPAGTVPVDLTFLVSVLEPTESGN